MSAYDSSFNIIGTSLAAPSEEALAQGATPYIEVSFTIGQALPIENPDNPGEALRVPAGMHRYKFSRSQAIDFFTAGLEQAEKLSEEKKANILVANDLGAVERAAAEISRIVGK